MNRETIRKLLVVIMSSAMIVYMVALGATIFILAEQTLKINQDVQRTLDGIKLLCPEENIKEDGVPAEEEDDEETEYDLDTLPTEVVNYEYEKEVGDYVYIIYI